MYRAESVVVLGSPVGNQWILFTGDKRLCLCTYHGNTLVYRQKYTDGRINLAEAERAIEALYA